MKGCRIMNTENDEIDELRKSILNLIQTLIVEVSAQDNSTILARSNFLKSLTTLERILSDDQLDLDRLKMDNFGIYRTATDDDFQHTPLGEK
jgi:predicted RNA binding protein with dsRBD fold (UPF0201 family)